MTDGPLPARRIDRAALERIIRRAAELQAGEMDPGESLTEADVLRLGAEVGIDGRFLRQALHELAAGAPAEAGLVARWFGPRAVAASRVVPGDRAAVEAALERWMVDGEALTIKRRMPDRTVWERQRGFLADMKRGFGAGGRSYHLARAHEVSASVTQLEPGFCHVALAADVGDRRSGAVTGAAVGTGLLVATSLGLAGLLSAGALPLALLPLGGAVALSLGAPRGYRAFAGNVQLGLEQLLDRLEHGEITPPHEGRDASPLALLAREIRRAITSSSLGSRHPHD